MERKRKWTEKDLRIAVKNSTSIRQVLSKLNLVEAGGNYAQIKKYIEILQISTSHFTGTAWNKGLRYNIKPVMSLDQILVKNSFFQSYKLKQRLFKNGLKSARCEECGWAKKAENGRLPLELDHINGNRRDNRLENLKILCPNCHSLKSTHRGLNRRKRPSGEIGKHATLKML